MRALFRIMYANPDLLSILYGIEIVCTGAIYVVTEDLQVYCKQTEDK